MASRDSGWVKVPRPDRTVLGPLADRFLGVGKDKLPNGSRRRREHKGLSRPRSLHLVVPHPAAPLGGPQKHFGSVLNALLFSTLL